MCVCIYKGVERAAAVKCVRLPCGTPGLCQEVPVSAVALAGTEIMALYEPAG